MTHYTIEVDARVEQGRVLIDLPADVPDGVHHLVVHIQDGSDAMQTLELPTPRAWENWPATSTFRREEMYDQ